MKHTETDCDCKGCFCNVEAATFIIGALIVGFAWGVVVGIVAFF